MKLAVSQRHNSWRRSGSPSPIDVSVHTAVIRNRDLNIIPRCECLTDSALNTICMKVITLTDLQMGMPICNGFWTELPQSTVNLSNNSESLRDSEHRECIQTVWGYLQHEKEAICTIPHKNLF
jgi:hypothetical protein